MNTPEQDNHHHFILVGIAGTIVCLLLIASLFFIVHIEEQSRTKQHTLVQSPELLTQHQDTPTPIPTYAPQIPGMNTQEAFDLFKRDTFDKDIYRTEKHLVRWEQVSIPWRLRGQFTPEDTVCMQNIAQQFNTAMEVSLLEEQSAQSGRSGIEIYLLPSDQFSSVNPDIRPEQVAQMFYTLSGYQLSSAEILVDKKQSTDFRCYYLRNLMLQAVGIANPVLGNQLIGQSTSPSFLQYGRLDDLDLEMLRILYSPLLTAGLTQEETKRRIVR